MDENKRNVVYILQCADGTLYTGWTNDLARRVRAHNSGCGAKYTKSRLPVTLVYWEPAETREAGLRREHEIKRMSRAEKLRMIQSAVASEPDPQPDDR